MPTDQLLETARSHVRRYFSKHMPARLRYHDLEHTLAVARNAVEIGRASGLKAEDLVLLELAALFHDTGYASTYDGHEEASAALATAWLASRNVGAGSIRKVATLIRATRVGHAPRGVAQRALRDADSAKAGQADFMEKSERLRRERMHFLDLSISRNEWQEENLAYLEHHRFHTAYARERFGRQKEINLAFLRRSIAEPTAEGRPKGDPGPAPFMDRELSWLSFNARVLQEAQDPSVPLLERLKFVAIHSSNLDEFYRVRVAQLRSLRKLGKGNRSALGVPPGKHIDQINRIALEQQAALGKTYRGTLLPALRANGIRFLKPTQLSKAHQACALTYFKERVQPLLRTMPINAQRGLFIEDRRLYLVVSLARKEDDKHRTVVVNVPAEELGRFLTLPSTKGRTDLIYLDDVIRLGAPGYFKGWAVKACHAIKLSRDAELYVDEEFTEDVAEKVRRSLRKRSTGLPARFLYDSAMPPATLQKLVRVLQVKKRDMLPGGRYHNLNDLMSAPLAGHPDLREKPLPPLRHPALTRPDHFRAMRAGDILLHFPYHDFSSLVELVVQASVDPAVERIAVTLYRVARRSRICGALVAAAKAGKQVDVLMEVQARFDEDNNLFWGSELAQAGARVSYGLPRYKVHCKLLLIDRRERSERRRYAYLGTGNFNEQTARIYSDMGLLTTRKALCEEVHTTIERLMNDAVPAPTKLLVTSPDHLRNHLERAIDREIEQALLGKPASILLKLNSLEDKPLIRKLYDADRAGVQVRLIIRGICCLVTQVPGHSATIEGISIVDRFLEHTRVYVFHDGGRTAVHLASADWMERNLDRRVEVAFPILNERLKQEVLRFLELQWTDNMKARVLDRGQTNRHITRRKGARKVRSQEEWYQALRHAAGGDDQ